MKPAAQSAEEWCTITSEAGPNIQFEHINEMHPDIRHYASAFGNVTFP